MSLSDQDAKQEALQRAALERLDDPDLDAKLDRFIAEHPQLKEHYSAMSKDELIRGMMLQELQLEKRRAAIRSSRVLQQWVKENPDIVEKVSARLQKPEVREAVPLPEAPKQGQRASKGVRR